MSVTVELVAVSLFRSYTHKRGGAMYSRVTTLDFAPSAADRLYGFLWRDGKYPPPDGCRWLVPMYVAHRNAMAPVVLTAPYRSAEDRLPFSDEEISAMFAENWTRRRIHICDDTCEEQCQKLTRAVTLSL